MGDCKTYYALQVAACCIETRCAIPTSNDTVPFICNIFGFTFCFNCDFVSFCCKPISVMLGKERETD